MDDKSKLFTSVGRIAKIFNRIEHFAKVEIIIETRTQEESIIFAVPLLEDGYEQASLVKDAWKKGAAAGIMFAMKQCAIPSYIVTVTKIEGTYADTNPTIVGAAAIDAVWKFSHFDDQKERQRIEGIVRNSWNKPMNTLPDFAEEDVLGE